MCCCTCFLMSVMSRWPDLDSNWVRAYEEPPWRMVAAIAAPTIIGRSEISFAFITLSISGRERAGRTRLDARLTIISKKQPERSQRRGLISTQISGRMSLSFGLGRCAVKSALRALLVLREGLSAERKPPLPRPKPELPK